MDGACRATRLMRQRSRYLSGPQFTLAGRGRGIAGARRSSDGWEGRMMLMRRLGRYLMGVAAVCMVAGCSANEEQRSCETLGALGGAVVGAGIATAVILTEKNHSSHESTYFAWGIPAGLAAGGLAGGVIG